MDLLFSRYADPFLFLNNLIKSNSLHKGLLSLIQFKEEELTWQMYCSLLSNPMSKIKSYKDFKASLQGKRTTETKSKELKEIEVKNISEKSNNILSKFKPR